MKLGFIGTGNMASAIMGGIIKKQVVPADEIIGADLFEAGRERAKAEHGIHVTDSNKEVIEKARASKALERHLEVKIEDNIYDELISKI